MPITAREFLSLLGLEEPPEPLLIQPSWSSSSSSSTTASIPVSDIHLCPEELPSGDSALFKESSFFQSSTSLPSPSEVRAASGLNYPGRSRIARFPALNMIVKYGRSVTIAEGQCLWAIRRLIPSMIPVPEIYGWCRDGKDTFLYMEMIHGKTLEDEWEHLSGVGKKEIAKQLRGMMDTLRLIKQGSRDPLIGHIGYQPLCDIIFEGIDLSSCPPGPFHDLSAFHDYLTRLPRPQNYRPGDPEHPLRPIFPDVFQLRFTHGDLNPRNILISTEGKDSQPRVVAIVDWHQAGWLPEYWEYFKTLFTVSADSDWATEYVPLFLQPYHGYGYWHYFAGMNV